MWLKKKKTDLSTYNTVDLMVKLNAFPHHYRWFKHMSDTFTQSDLRCRVCVCFFFAFAVMLVYRTSARIIFLLTQTSSKFPFQPAGVFFTWLGSLWARKKRWSYGGGDSRRRGGGPWRARPVHIKSFWEDGTVQPFVTSSWPISKRTTAWHPPTAGQPSFPDATHHPGRGWTGLCPTFVYVIKM